MSWVYIKLSLRHFFKRKTYSTINIVGLTIGFTAYILVTLHIQYEKSWDKQNVNYQRIYRAQRHYVTDFLSRDGHNISPHSRGLTAKLITQTCPEVENTVVLMEIKDLYLSDKNENMIYDNTGCFIDKSVFDVFTYRFIKGNPATALNTPNSIVLSESLANKLFPNCEALGKNVLADKKFNLLVTGIYADLPMNTHYRPNYLVSMSTIENKYNVHDDLAGYYMTYVLLKKGTNPQDVNKKVYNLFKGVTSDSEKEKIVLCPMYKFHLSFNDRNDYYLVLFLYNLIGILILVLSSINYINLITANATSRIKETIVNKIHGGNRLLITIQFIAEAVILSTISLLIAFFMANQLLIPFNSIIGQDLKLFTPENIPFILQTVGITLLIGMLSGIYPAYFLVRNNITDLLKGNLTTGISNVFSFRKILVGFQFTASIFLIVIAIYTSSQIRYVLTKDLGFNKDNLLYVKINSSQSNFAYSDIKSRLLRHPEIINVSVSRHLPFISFGGGTVNWEGSRPDEIVNIRNNRVSHDFFETLEIPLIEGRNFLPDFSGDATDKCIINRTAWKTFGWKNPIGKHIDNGRMEIIGVVEDFHFTDMHNSIEPSVFYLKTGKIEGDWTFAFRTGKSGAGTASKIITSEFEKIFPNDPFEVKIVDNGFRNESTMLIYKSIYKTIVFFTTLLIILAVIGLLGLVSFITQQRTKEIGIRKINGCSSKLIFIMLNKELLTLVGISSVFALAAEMWIIPRFPGNYLRPFEWWIPAIGVAVVIIVVLMVSMYQTIKVANANPVEALRYE
jgi:putative ABC transport system permease protein